MPGSAAAQQEASGCGLLKVLRCCLGRNPGLVPRTLQQLWLLVLVVIGVLVGIAISGQRCPAAFAQRTRGILS